MFRNIARNKFYVALNILGLIFGITCSLLLFSFVLNEFRYDSYHRDSQRVYRISCSTIIDEKRTDFANLPPAFGPAIREHISEIEYMGRLSLPFPINNGISKIEYGDRVFYEPNIYMADSSIFQILTYDFILGTARELQEPNTIVLTETLAAKLLGADYFEYGMPQTPVEINELEFTVVGIIKDVPSYSHIRPAALISWAGLGIDDIWDDSQAYTYVKLNEHLTRELFNAKLMQFATQDENIKATVDRFGAQVVIESQAVNEIHLASSKQYEVYGNANWTNIYVYILVGVFFTLSSAVNYLNLSIAISQKRAKEVGVRKVLGAHSFQIQGQFFRESLILTVLAGLLSVGAFYLLLPSFSKLMRYEIDWTILLYPKFILTALGMMIIIAAIAGVYPSMYLSRLSPSEVLKNRSARKEKVSLRKVLIIFQFVISAFMITVIIGITAQINFLSEKPLGFNKDNVLVVKIPESEDAQLNLRSFKASLVLVPYVSASSISDFLPGTTNMLDEHKVERKNGEMKSSTVARIFADGDFLSLMSLPIVQGRGLDLSNPTDYDNAFMVNETAVRYYGWDQMPEGPIGKTIDGFNYAKKGKVIGVFRDAHLFSLKEAIKPLIINYSNVGYYLYIRTTESGVDVIRRIEEEYNKHFSDYPFDYVFLDDRYSTLYEPENKLKNSVASGTVVLIFLSCLGLLGLSSFIMALQTKQIGVRKVLGAKTSQIFTLFGKDFLTQILIANLIAFPISYLFLQNFLSQYSNHLSMQWWFFAIPLASTMLVTILTVSYSILKAARVNPVSILKQE